MELVFDIEANGFLEDVSKIYVISCIDVATGKQRTFDITQGNIKEGLKLLSSARVLIGHNIMGYDIPAIKKLYPKFKYGKIFDTLLVSRLIWTDLLDRDFVAKKKRKTFSLPPSLFGSHSLAAWGHRLGEHKTEYNIGFETYHPSMVPYCEQDVVVTLKLYNLILSKHYSKEAIELEHQVNNILCRQTEYGFYFDKPKAEKLYQKLLVEKVEIQEKLCEVFKPKWVPVKEFTPKRSNRTLGYVEGVPLTLVKLETFNPGSRKQIIDRLTSEYKWKPTEFTDKGNPKINDDILEALDHPEAALLAHYLLLTKRLGQIGDGKNAWLKLERNGVIHGNVICNGAVTGRMTHNNPNMAQVPSVRSLYGRECRELFKARPERVIVGIDASGLELRCLAHYLYNYDDGRYVELVTKGDVHTKNQHDAGLPTRDDAKTFIYALIYGAGDAKIGEIVGGSAKEGKALKTKFLNANKALKTLVNQIKRQMRNQQTTFRYLRGLDGRLLYIRSEHSSLNTLLQSAGALIMKKALVIFDSLLMREGLTHGIDYEFVANVHDEWQIETKPEHKDVIISLGLEAMRLSGEHFNFKCPIEGEAKVGKTWADTH